MTRFSIILPIYNVEKYLPACIDSIIDQNYKDYEIILVDDGSKDTSGRICDDYSLKYDSVRVIHKPNGGQSDARNVGLKKAIGEYVFFVDSDDYLIDNNVLSRINNRIESASPDVIAFKSIKWFESTGKTSTSTVDLSVSANAVQPYQKYLELIDKDTYSNSAWSKVIRRSLLVDNNIEFEKGLLGEDNDWYYKVVEHIQSLELINEPLYVYRQREGSITKTYTKKNLEHLLWLIEKWIRIINEGDFDGNKEVIRNSLSKQYCHAIIGYSQLKDAKEFFPRLKSLNYLLQYSNNPRVKAFRRLNRLIGLRGTILLLRMRNLLK